MRLACGIGFVISTGNYFTGLFHQAAYSTGQHFNFSAFVFSRPLTSDLWFFDFSVSAF
jgi:hypothetical protein